MAENPFPGSLTELLAQLDAMGIRDARRYAAVRRFLNRKAREQELPVTGSFELTPLCNFACKMCYVHLTGAQMTAPLLSVAQWKDIMSQAIDGGMLYASLTGGECLTYPGFRELYCFLRDKGVEVTILSNGCLMDGQMAHFLKANPPAGVQVTVYGASEEGYQRVTGQRAFAQVLENLRRLRDLGIPLKAAVTPNAFMEDGEDVIRLLDREKIPFVINTGLLPPREETGRTVQSASLDDQAAMLRLSRTLRGYSPEEDCEARQLPPSGTEGKIREGTCPRGVVCGAGRSAFAVDWQGGMRPCNAFPCKPQSVPELGFSQAWHRVNQIARDYQRPVECQDCGYRRICKHCVSEHATAPQGHADPAVCDWVKKMVYEGLLALPRES